MDALYDDLLVDRFGGEQLAGLGQLCDGGVSRDWHRHHLHHHQRGGFDRRIVEERVYPDPSPSVDEQLALRAERSLLVQEEQERRMLQLTMGRNFGDRIDLFGMGIGEPRTSGVVARFPLVSVLEYDI